jgi:hypothetical protein
MGEEQELVPVRGSFTCEQRGRLLQEFVESEHLGGANDICRMHQDRELSTLSLRFFQFSRSISIIRNIVPLYSLRLLDGVIAVPPQQIRRLNAAIDRL